MIKLPLLFAFIILSGCSYFTPAPQPLIELSAKTTALANSGHTTQAEYKNRFVVDTNRIDAKINKGFYHLAYRYSDIRSDGDDKNHGISLINTKHYMLGAGIHTNKGTAITYYRDLNNDLWMIDVNSRLNVRPKLNVIAGVFHLDKTGGSLISSGGRRTTGVRVGLEHLINRSFSIEGIYEKNNNGSDFTEDRFLTGLNYRW